MSKQFFLNVLTQIRENQKNIAVQTSIHLKKIEAYLFSSKGPQPIKPSQAELLYLGVPQEDIQGLFLLSGTSKTFMGLKKSAYYCLEIIHKTVTKGKYRDVFENVLVESSEKDLACMKLATHICDDAGSKTAALQLCCLIKTKRPFLQEIEYILSSEARKIFQAFWVQEQIKKKKSSKQAQMNPITLAIQEDTTEKKGEMVHAPRVQNNQTVSISTDIDKLQVFEDYLNEVDDEYYIDTFVDIFDILKAVVESKQPREIIKLKRLLYFLVDTPVSLVYREKIEKVFEKIHIQHPNFNPSYLFSKYHSDIKQQQLKQLIRVIPQQIGKSHLEYLLKYFFDDLVKLNVEITIMKDNFTQTEGIKRNSSVAFTLRTKMKHSMKQLSDKVQPLYEKYEQHEKLRKLILFLQTNQEFLKLPAILSELLDSGNLTSLSNLYNKYLSLIGTYRKTPVLKSIIEEVEQVIAQARIRQIKNVLHGYQQHECSLLLELFSESTGDNKHMENYLVPKMVSEMIKQLHLHFGEKQNQEFKLSEKLLKKHQMFHFFDIVAYHNEAQIQTEGDLLELFLKESARQQGIALCEQLKQGKLQKIINLLSILSKWEQRRSKKFKEIDLLIGKLLQLYRQIMKEMKQLGSFEELELACRLLMECQKHTKKPEHMASIVQLKKENFTAFCGVQETKIKKGFHFGATPIKHTIEGECYNLMLANLLDLIVEHSKNIINYPSFKPQGSYLSRFQKYITECLMVDEQLLLGLPELFSYSTLVHCAIESSYMKPFYAAMSQFPSLKASIEEALKQKNKKIQQILYSIIKVQYIATMRKNKQSPFALQILNYFNNYCKVIFDYASNSYKEHSRFIVQAFLVQAKSIAKDYNSDPVILKKFITELLVIKNMSQNINSNKIANRWEQLINTVQFSTQEKNSNQLYSTSLKHRYSINFCHLYPY